VYADHARHPLSMCPLQKDKQSCHQLSLLSVPEAKVCLDPGTTLSPWEVVLSGHSWAVLRELVTSTI